MEPFVILTSKLVPLPNENVDTDQIIPARYLKVTDKAGLAEGLFAGWRYRADGSPDPEFVLNKPEMEGRKILLAGDNFGTGSSREHAPWALIGWGFRAIISTGFADIFYNNALKNGLLPVVVDEETHRRLFAWVEEDPNVEVTIDLAQQVLILPDGTRVTFPIDPFSKHCLLKGLDQLGYLLEHLPHIEAYERTHPPRFDTRVLNR
ncbi:MAG: 3-isopropylmalate dehydratase small subunit [Chloroflexi bacterium]|nr:3-isopropylmalate dehydratase small subunit [Chloroflexota bacterium]